VNHFPWLAAGTLIAIALFVFWMVWRLPHAIDRAELRKARRRIQPGRERTRLSRHEERRFKRIARRTSKANPDLKQAPRNLTGGSHDHHS